MPQATPDDCRASPPPPHRVITPTPHLGRHLMARAASLPRSHIRTATLPGHHRTSHSVGSSGSRTAARSSRWTVPHLSGVQRWRAKAHGGIEPPPVPTVQGPSWQLFSWAPFSSPHGGDCLSSSDSSISIHVPRTSHVRCMVPVALFQHLLLHRSNIPLQQVAWHTKPTSCGSGPGKDRTPVRSDCGLLLGCAVRPPAVMQCSSRSAGDLWHRSEHCRRASWRLRLPVTPPPQLMVSKLGPLADASIPFASSFMRGILLDPCSHLHGCVRSCSRIRGERRRA
ncbi:uncharacterized protein LOC125541488 [Triticum urartu]|uniref:uncharacterized protein LOC125541488 n=1 Tax=Triticum urartu TaxID=4572 RepID=UPI0020435DD7|nr:uncharacterized protein LOC125541488 [Triticum urartu]